MRANRAHTLRRFAVNSRQHALLKTGFAAVNLRTHQLKRQRTFYKHHLAIRLLCYALRLEVEGPYAQPTVW